ncbi:hypothetical protein V6N13_148315 [Hibiscus sabdariffa]|uniref:Uncharacterized protein n=1 Tax=Hibiscus sabdariffa TaxID=183260 RepID=A0ABR2TYZ6_9ROSI
MKLCFALPPYEVLNPLPNIQRGPRFHRFCTDTFVSTRRKEHVAPLILVESSPVMLAPWHSLSGSSAFEVVNEKDVWSYAEVNPGNDALLKWRWQL